VDKIVGTPPLRDLARKVMVDVTHAANRELSRLPGKRGELTIDEDFVR
jgi:hypothetical protein